MRYSYLRESVCRVNIELSKSGLTILTWGNASEVDRKAGVMAIKPSGVPFDKLDPDQITIVSLQTAEVIEGRGAPSSDTPTHIALYQRFESIGGIIHTHSTHATAFAQARREIPCLGTTHADYFSGPVPVTRTMTEAEIQEAYELNTGKVIIETIEREAVNPEAIPAILVANHGPFVWGPNAEKALENAIVLETVAEMADRTFGLNPTTPAISQVLLNKHFLRKHGPDAYYGQKSGPTKRP